MSGLASDLNNRDFVGAMNPDDILFVTFYKRSMQDNFQSEKQGKPVFYEVDYVKIMAPGNQLSVIDTEVREDHKFRFPRQWERFKSGQMGADTQLVGTPVEEWPAITRTQAEELKSMKFFTVEQIAGASDLQVQQIGMNSQFIRQKAQAFIKTANDTSLAQAQAVELAKRDTEIQKLKEANERMLEKMDMLMAIDDKPRPKLKRKFAKHEEEKEPNADA